MNDADLSVMQHRLVDYFERILLAVLTQLIVDKDDDAENDAENGDGSKSARKSKKDSEGDEPKPKGRKGKKQV